MAKKKKCVAIYVLMSAASHEGGKSLEAQMAECTAFLMSLGYSVDDACVYREVGKAASLDRPQLAELLGLAVAGELEALVVCGADRLARDESQLQVLLGAFADYGVDVHVVRSELDASVNRDVVRSVFDDWQRLERTRMRKRTVRGKDMAARAGRMPTGMSNPPYGHDYDRLANKLVVNDAESQVVEDVFRRFADGWSMAKIAESLNAEGVPSKKGGAWNTVRIHSVLTNSRYIGVDYYGKTRMVSAERGVSKRVSVPREEWVEIRGYTPALVPVALFWKVNERLEGRMS